MGIFSMSKEIKALKTEINRLKAAKKTPSGTTKLPFGISFLPRFLRSDYTLQNSELIFSAVTRRANALSSMPVQLYRGTTPVKNDDRNDIVNCAPNPNQTACQFLNQWRRAAARKAMPMRLRRTIQMDA